MNYVKHVIESRMPKYKRIPDNWGGTRYHSMRFEGWKFEVSAGDNSFNIFVSFIADVVKLFIKTYKNECAFSEPQFSIQDRVVFVKIAIMELELYEQMKEREKNLNDKCTEPLLKT